MSEVYRSLRVPVREAIATLRQCEREGECADHEYDSSGDADDAYNAWERTTAETLNALFFDQSISNGFRSGMNLRGRGRYASEMFNDRREKLLVITTDLLLIDLHSRRAELLQAARAMDSHDPVLLVDSDDAEQLLTRQIRRGEVLLAGLPRPDAMHDRAYQDAVAKESDYRAFNLQLLRAMFDRNSVADDFDQVTTPFEFSVGGRRIDWENLREVEYRRGTDPKEIVVERVRRQVNHLTRLRGTLPVTPRIGSDTVTICREPTFGMIGRSTVARSDPDASTTVPSTKTILSLHGIRTRGAWQKDLSQLLTDEGFRHIPLDYGNFPIAWLLIPKLREKKIRWFWTQYEEYVREGEVPDVIAHSFGTYIVCEALRMHSGVKVGRMILCGAIVDPEYPWREIVAQGRVGYVLNDYGSADIWTRIVGYLVADAGPSGHSGFTGIDEVPVAQRLLPDWGHSDFFNRLHVKSWIAFLKRGAVVAPGVEASKRIRHRKVVARVLTGTFALFAALLVVAALVRPTPLGEGVTAMKYGNVGPTGRVENRALARELGDPDVPQRVGETVVTLRRLHGFSHMPRRWIAARLGEPVAFAAGERLRVMHIRDVSLLGVWVGVTPLPKPEGLEKFAYRYRYTYADQCLGFLLSNDRDDWVEYTAGEGDCHKSRFAFRRIAGDADHHILYRPTDGGWFFRIPVQGGRSALAGGVLPSADIESLRWAPHYFVTRLDSDSPTP